MVLKCSIDTCCRQIKRHEQDTDNSGLFVFNKPRKCVQKSSMQVIAEVYIVIYKFQIGYAYYSVIFERIHLSFIIVFIEYRVVAVWQVLNCDIVLIS